MNIDTTIYGYIGDGFICCNTCAETIARDAGGKEDDEQATKDDYELADLQPLGAYSGLHDRPCGETCECGEVIVEEDEDHGLGEDGCPECGYVVPHLWAAVTPRRTVLGRFQTEGEAEDYIWEYDQRLIADGYPIQTGATVIELDYDNPVGPGGRLPIPGEVPLFPQPAAFIEAQFTAAIQVDHLTNEQIDQALHALRNV